MQILPGNRTVPSPARLLLVLAFAASAAARADDYVRGLEASAASKAYFEAVPAGLPETKVAATNEPERDGDSAWFTEDGAISIPPGAMIEFSLSGHGLDPDLPDPDSGDPMQAVDVGLLVPSRLRSMYDNLLLRKAQGDPAVLGNDPQQLVRAIRTAGTEDSAADNLSDEQLRVLDECAGRRGAFLKYHEKMKRKNARKARRDGTYGNGRGTAGTPSRDTAGPDGTNTANRVEGSTSTPAGTGRTSTVRTPPDFRYGEIGNDLYSDISGDGGLALTARILNASGRRREFRPWDFAAQVGDGSRAGGKRQRVALDVPDEFKLVRGAAAADVEAERSLSEPETGGDAWQPSRLRGHVRQRRTERSGDRDDELRDGERRGKYGGIYRRIWTDLHTTVEEFPTVPPVKPVPPPPPPPPVRLAGTGASVQTDAEPLALRTMGLDWDKKTRRGTLLVEIRSGAFRSAAAHVRTRLGELVRDAASRFPPADPLPEGVSFAADSISIRDDDLCEVRFSVQEEKESK
jgi:hypothetical protein